jgi:hypothetical protein
MILNVSFFVILQIGVVDYIPDERYRPSLPSDVLDNSRQCVQIEVFSIQINALYIKLKFYVFLYGYCEKPPWFSFFFLQNLYKII